MQPDRLTHETAGGLTRAYWQAKAMRRIGQRPGAELDTAGLLARNLRITEAYAELYLRDPATYKWAGMAALTSATVGRGMYLLLLLRRTGLCCLAGLFRSDAARAFEQLIAGNLLVFTDIYWQHLAYDQAGLEAIEAAARAGELDAQVLGGWRLIDAGRREGDPARVWEGNTILLKYEQERVLQPGVYDANLPLWQELAGWVPSPMPGQLETFADHRPGGNIGVFEERWRWIEARMLPRWRELSDSSAARVQRALLGSIRLSTWASLLGAPRSRPALGRFHWLHAARGLVAAAL